MTKEQQDNPVQPAQDNDVAHTRNMPRVKFENGSTGNETKETKGHDRLRSPPPPPKKGWYDKLAEALRR